MAQSLAQVYLHSIFSTKHRQPLILPEIESPLQAYTHGIVKSMKSGIIAMGGMPDHVHILSTLPRTVPISKYLEEIKKSSSKWIKTQGEKYKGFAWQGGYAVFSVSSSKVEAVSNYILNQKEHHRKITYQEEVSRFLEEYGLEYDERHLWD